MSRVPRLVMERGIDLINYPISAALAAKTIAGAKVRGIDSGLVGMLPGMLLDVNASGELVLAEGAGSLNILGVGFNYVAPQADPSQEGYIFSQAGEDAGAIIPLSDSVIEVGAYLIEEDGAATALTYAIGDLLYRSTLGFLTKDDSTDKTILGKVVGLNEGNLRVQLFRKYST